MDIIKINEDVSVAAQPSESQLRDLPDRGFRSIVNFRTEGEKDQPLSPEREGDMAKEIGLRYLHIPISLDAMHPDSVERFREYYRDLPKPIFAHCASGQRAGAMVMMHLASEQGMSGEETLQKAEQPGIRCDKPELKQFVRQYVDNHSRNGS